MRWRRDPTPSPWRRCWPSHTSGGAKGAAALMPCHNCFLLVPVLAHDLASLLQRCVRVRVVTVSSLLLACESVICNCCVRSPPPRNRAYSKARRHRQCDSDRQAIPCAPELLEPPEAENARRPPKTRTFRSRGGTRERGSSECVSERCGNTQDAVVSTPRTPMNKAVDRRVLMAQRPTPAPATDLSVVLQPRMYNGGLLPIEHKMWGSEPVQK